MRDRASFCKSPLLSHRGGEEDDDEDADLELERAIEGLDADTGTEADTLEEVSGRTLNVHLHFVETQLWSNVVLHDAVDGPRD